MLYEVITGYNVIYVNSQGEEVGKGRHARFERLNYIELDCSDERISTVLFLSTLKDLRVKEQNIMAAALSVIIIQCRLVKKSHYTH